MDRGPPDPCHTRDVGKGKRATSSEVELATFEVATRDLVGVALASIEDLDVSLPQLRLLVVLEELGRSSSTRCARALGVAGSSVTRMVERLHSAGLLDRGTDPDNRSVVTLELTDAGRRVVRQVRSRRRRRLGEILDRLEPDERATCAAALEKLHRMLVDDGGDGRPDLLPL